MKELLHEIINEQELSITKKILEELQSEDEDNKSYYYKKNCYITSIDRTSTHYDYFFCTHSEFLSRIIQKEGIANLLTIIGYTIIFKKIMYQSRHLPNDLIRITLNYSYSLEREGYYYFTVNLNEPYPYAHMVDVKEIIFPALVDLADNIISIIFENSDSLDVSHLMDTYDIKKSDEVLYPLTKKVHTKIEEASTELLNAIRRP